MCTDCKRPCTWAQTQAVGDESAIIDRDRTIVMAAVPPGDGTASIVVADKRHTDILLEITEPPDDVLERFLQGLRALDTEQSEEPGEAP